MMEAARTYETSVDNYFTRQYIPEDKSEPHTRRSENLKSHVHITGLGFYWFIFFLVYGLRLCLRTSAINGPIVLLPDDDIRL
jgi:hypothetical protein